MMYGTYKTHYQAWNAYRRQRERLLAELDEFPCAQAYAQGCRDCCGGTTTKVEFLMSCLRAVAMAEDYHGMMHKSRLVKRMNSRRAA